MIWKKLHLIKDQEEKEEQIYLTKIANLNDKIIIDDYAQRKKNIQDILNLINDIRSKKNIDINKKKLIKAFKKFDSYYTTYPDTSSFTKIFLYILAFILIVFGLIMIIDIIFALFAYPYAKKYEQMKTDAGIEPYSSLTVFWNSLRGLFFINEFKKIVYISI